MSEFHTVDDFAPVARKRLPRAMFDFIAGGAGTESAQRNNESLLRTRSLVPRVLRATGPRSTSVRLFGVDYAVPFGVSPMGLGNLAWPGTDTALLKAAAQHGMPYVLSAAGSSTIEDASALAGSSLWFQLYVGADQVLTEQLLARALSAGVRTVLLTVDAAHPGLRHRDRRSHFGRPILGSPRLLWDYASHPRWSLSTLGAGVPRMINLVQGIGGEGAGKGAGKDEKNRQASRYVGAEATRTFMASMMQARLDMDMLDRIRALWPHQLLVKGVLDRDDAVSLLQSGVDGLVISNHGGRQLGSAVSPAQVMAGIRAAVGEDAVLIYDSGIRSGEDVVKALCLGADFVLLGRPWLFACAAAGPTVGAERLANLLREEVDNTLAQLGCANLAALKDVRMI